jgi:hypothetical protein
MRVRSLMIDQYVVTTSRLNVDRNLPLITPSVRDIPGNREDYGIVVFKEV